MQLILTKNKIFSGILLFGLITIPLIIFDIQYFYLGAIFSFIFLATIPGLLILLILKIRKIGFWEYLVYTVGLSISFLMFAGLAINWTLPWLHITDKPLALFPLLVSFDTILLIFGIIAYIRNKDLLLIVKLPELNWLNKIFFLIPVIFPILSVLGAITLNNGGSNYLTMIMLGGIGFYVFFVVLFRNRLNINIYPFSILFIGSSLLLMFSLRSWHVIASDTSIEYQMFQSAKANFRWSMSNLRHAYNSCLSISILPTIFSLFLKINDEYIFKLIFPIIVSFVPLSVFLIAKKYIQEIYAFFAFFYFVSFSSFFYDLNIQVRQGIAFLFFSLTLSILFNDSVNPIVNKLFFFIFGFSMIVSHYSTTYISLGIFIFTYFIFKIFVFYENRKHQSTLFINLNNDSKDRKSYLTGTMITILIVFTIFWYSFITGTAGALTNVTYNIIGNIGNIFNEQMKDELTSFSAQWNIFYRYKDQEPTLKNYILQVVSKSKNNPNIIHYSPDVYGEYKPHVVKSKLLPLNIKLNIALKVYLLNEIINKLLKIFIITGIIYLLFSKFKGAKIDTEYVIMVLGCFFCLATMMILPLASIEYGTDRLYQQMLVLLSLPAVIGALALTKFINIKYINIINILVIFILYFLFSSGFISQIIGGTDATVQLNNFGIDYYKFYTLDSEAKSARWLSTNYDNKSFINTDNRGGRLHAFDNSNHFIFQDGEIILPATMDKNAYVYISYSNKVKNIGFIRTLSTSIIYNFPINFLNRNKNLIYNNGYSEIFK